MTTQAPELYRDRAFIVRPSDITAYYQLNGDLVDSGQHGLAGAISNGNTYVSGGINQTQAAHFAGSSDNIDLGVNFVAQANTDDLYNSSTINLFVRVDNIGRWTDGNQRDIVIISGGGNAINIEKSSVNNEIRVFRSGVGDQIPITPTLSWIMITMVLFENPTAPGNIVMSTYVNGELNNTKNVSTTSVSVINNATIGVNNVFNWRGDVDEVTIWSTDLTAQEVRFLYSGYPVNPFNSPTDSVQDGTPLPALEDEPVLRITDGETVINLIGDDRTGTYGTFTSEVRPSATGFKGGGVWQNSPFADGRQPVMSRWDNATETFNIVIRDEASTDSFAEKLRNLRTMLLKASQYWVSSHDTGFVWIEARASCETNIRYAIIYSGQIPEDSNHWSQPFLQGRGDHTMVDLALTFERGQWQAVSPNIDGEQMPILTAMPKPTVFSLYYDNGNRSLIDNDAAIRALFQDGAAFTVEGWYRFDAGETPSRTRYIFDFGQNPYALRIYIDPDKRLIANNLSINASSAVDFTSYLDSEWHHLAITYDDTVAVGVRFVRIWIDGEEATYLYQYPWENASTWGASDAEVTVSNRDASGLSPLAGSHSWLRISSSIRYTSSFTANSICFPPLDDVDTVTLHYLLEGRGLLSVNENNPGTMNLELSSSVEFQWQDACVILDGETDPITGEPVSSLSSFPQINSWSNTRLTAIWKVRVNASDEIIFDAGTGNMLDAVLPYEIVEPWRVAAGETEWTYVGVETVHEGAEIQWARPFSNIVFDVSEQTVYATSADASTENKRVELQYLNTAGNWQTVTSSDVFDRTQTFTNLGKNAIMFPPPLSPNYWGAQLAIDNNGDPDPTSFLSGDMGLGIWIRFRIADEYTTTPEVELQPYTQTTPSFTVLAEDISGEVDAILDLEYTTLTQYVSALAPETNWSRIHIGTRGIGRGPSFAPVFHATEDFSKPRGVSYFLSSVVSGGTQLDFPFATAAAGWNVVSGSYTIATGTALTFDTIGKNPIGEFTIAKDVASEYVGVYRALAMVRIVTATAQFALDIQSGSGSTATRYISNQVIANALTTTAEYVIDFGQVEITRRSSRALLDEVKINLRYIGSNNGGTCTIHWANVMLIPADEFYTTLDYTGSSTDTPGLEQNMLDVNSLDPKHELVASTRVKSSRDKVIGWFDQTNINRLSLSPDSDQRVYAIFLEEVPVGRFRIPTIMSTQVTPRYIQRYLSLRGDE